MRCSVVALAMALGPLGSAPAAAQCLRFVADIADTDSQTLDGVQGVAISPDGKALYVAAIVEDALGVYERDPETGALALLEAERDGLDGVDGLNGVSEVAPSPDGKHVYVTGVSDDSLVVFAKDAGGMLDFVEVERDQVAGVSGIDGPFGVAVTPDGKHVYVAGGTSDSVAVFSRNATTGEVAFVEAVTDAANGAHALQSPIGVAVSPDGASVYVASLQEDALSVFSRNPADGTLSFLGATRDGVGGVDGLDGAIGVAVSPDGASVYVAAQTDVAIASFSRNALGQVTYIGVVKNGVDGVVDLGSPFHLAVSPDGRRLWVSGGTLVGFARDPATGALAFWESRVDRAVPPEDRLSGASGVAVSRDGRHLYVGAALDDAITAYEWPELLRVADVERDGENGVDGLADPFFVALSPDQRHVYVAGSVDDAIAVFTRDAASGALSFVEYERNGVGGVNGLDGPSGIAFAPDGKQLYATGIFSDAVVVFTRNVATGALDFLQSRRDGLGGVDGLGGASAILASPDGAHVYIGGYLDNALATFTRDGATGGLSFVDALFDGQGAEALSGAGGAQMAMDALGRHLYVPAAGESALSVFERDAATGALSELQVLRDGLVVAPLGFAFHAALAPDDALLYVTAFDDDAIASFVRDPETGVLDFLELESNGTAGVVGLDEPRGLARSGDGTLIFAAAQAGDSVVAFDHDLAFGSTEFAAVATHTRCGYRDLDAPSSVAFAGRHAYVAASQSNAVTVLTPEPSVAFGAAVALAALAVARRRTGAAGQRLGG